MNPTILILTGELSGDQHIATIIPDLKKHYPDASLHALGGPALQAAEVPCFATIASLNVMGLFHAIKRLPSLLTIYFRTKQMIHLLKPDLTIMVDSPAFNLRLCKFAAQYGKVLYYITPKVWAHGQKRITIMQAYIHHLAVIFPFEAAYFKAHDIPCTYVGNPVYQAPLPYGSKDLARAALNIPKDAHVVGLLPGSRPQEITAMLPILANTAKAYHRVHPKTIFLLPLAPTLTKSGVAPYLKDTPIRMIDRQSRTIMQASDFLIITSGTATLEAAHVGTPMAIIYKVSRLTAL
jgi:lipid-A-disaccharide synthase